MEKHIAVAEINGDSKDDIFEEHPTVFVAPYNASFFKSPPVRSSPADILLEIVKMSLEILK